MTPTAYRTLVVDDEPEIRRLTSRALSRCGFDCDTAEDGEDALAQYRDKRHDLVITDLRMPRRHGHSLVVELLAERTRPRIVVLTALAEPRLMRDLLGRGVDEVLNKPVNYDVLAMKLLALLENDEWKPVADIEETDESTPRMQLLSHIEQSLADLSEVFLDRLNPLFPQNDELPDPPSAVKHLIERFDANDSDAHLVDTSRNTSRKKDRVTIAATAVAVPVDRNFTPRGEPFKLAIRDLSETGARLLHTRATNADYLALRWHAETIPYQMLTVPSRVMRCRPQSPFYDIGCQFVLND